MIQALSGKYRKWTAFFLFLPFYLQIGLESMASNRPGNFKVVSAFIGKRNAVATPFPQYEVSNGPAPLGIDKPGTANILDLSGLLDKIQMGEERLEQSAEDIGGPGQPEMSSFASVNGGNMVDLFSGDFSYNIPLLDVGGYPVNIHYNSGVTIDQEASWVGLGWNINPGTVTRNMRGLPDDFNGSDSITKTQNIKVNKTVGVKVGPNAETVSVPINIGYQLGVFHNNYNGFGIEYGVNASISLAKRVRGSLTTGDSSESTTRLNLGVSNNSQSGLSSSASLNVRLDKINKLETTTVSNYGISTNYHSRAGLSSLSINASNAKMSSLFRNAGLGSIIPSNVNISFAQPSVTPTISMPTTSSNFNFHGKVGGEWFGFHPNFFIEGYVAKQYIRKEDQRQKLPAYGYMYFTNSQDRDQALMDFNREKELQYSYKSTPHIAIPQYTYDVFAISGEGTGGTIRPYRGDIGYVHDHQMRTRSQSNEVSGEFGGGNLVHLGLAYNFVRSFTENNSWKTGNAMDDAVKFRKSDTSFQSVYFRNPGEKTTNAMSYYEQVGGDALMRVKLNDAQKANVSAESKFVKYKNGVDKDNEFTLAANSGKKERDKRSQVITWLTAEEAAMDGLDRMILSYKENTRPHGLCVDTIEQINRVDDSVRKKNHISEIRVLNGDGRRYVYGIPAYNIEQVDVSFSVNKETNTNNIDSGLVNYTKGLDNTTDNNKGKENYFSEERLPPYAHSYLITGILSPDYVDIKGDGITEDDQGDAIRFNYTRVYGPGQGYYSWRTPGSKEKANYNEGFKTYSRDDKGTYIYGRKEVWYTHSIESKTMIALFRLSSSREDAFSVLDSNGGINHAKALRRLDSIELYAKSDLVAQGTSARPVKTVHFEYDYSLCKNYAGSADKGKLTLKKIWFSYNKNEKGKQNPYVFTYHSSNPNYHAKRYDRWGNYKSGTGNFGNLNNADFPYVVQDSAQAALEAGSWSLSEIKLPSGGRMKITYEADDYAYVQNKRATSMFQISGFGESPIETPGPDLYRLSGTTATNKEYLFVTCPLGVTVSSKQDILQKFLEGNSYIYMKLAVKMPADRWGSGYEFVPVYARVADYGLTTVENRFWIKFEPAGNETPMVKYALQFLRLNLPSKAFPSSELGDNIDLGDAIKMLGSGFNEISNSVQGFSNASQIKQWCKTVETEKSFIRLNSPNYAKLGGGHRVKRVEIFDHWNTMTGQRESVYGQEYIYKTSIKVDGETKTISSGVATYEPMIGNEENPFRQPIDYSERMAPLAPASFLYSEMPLGESYFPGASVGYSKVRVRTINAKAKSANGWEETEFYTSKDFPTIVEHTVLDQDSKKRYKPRLLSLLKVYSVDRITVSQGFKVELNDMNGRVKAQASYAENDSINPISYVQNYYKVDDERAAVPKLNNSVWVVDSLNGHINKSGIIGKDIEVMMDFRQQLSQSVTGGVSPGLDGFVIPFIIPVYVPIPSLFKFPQFDESLFRSAATVKIVQRYGILDSVVVMDKGSVVSTKNLVYDGETGEVVLSRTNNEFNDPIYNFSYPAHWAYSGMGMAYKNIDAIFSNLILMNGKLYRSGGTEPFPVANFFESGDEIIAKGEMKMVKSGDDCNQLDPQSTGIDLPRKLWAIAAEKGKEKDRGIYFIDENGVPVSGKVDQMRILRSGKRNMLDASVGSVVSLENPVREVTTGNFRIVIDSNTKVINTSAVAYKDLWKVENSLYQKDSCYTLLDTVTNLEFYPIDQPRLFRTIRIRDGKKTMYYSTLTESASYQNEFIGSSRQLHRDNIAGSIKGDRYSYNFDVKSLIKFNLDVIPTSANITSANLLLYGTTPKTAWNNLPENLGNLPGIIQDYFEAKTNAHFQRGSVNGKTNENILRRAQSWNNYTQYSTLYTSSLNAISVPTAADNSCENKTVNVTGMVTHFVQNPAQNFGMVMQLKDEHVGKESQSSERTLSFCGRFPFKSTQPPASGCDTCIMAKLQVTYVYQKDTCVKLCRDNISDTSVNPYRWGILGNWRMDRAYTYYHDRMEADASSSTTNIRSEGVLKSFLPYWGFGDSILSPTTDTSRWVWNSAMSQYNRKGFEVENYDPLGRYNSGLYGYNQTLPVAVAQNSRQREILYDGFEDYSYETNDCVVCPNPRRVDFLTGQTGVTMVNTETHTGKYSLRVSSGNESELSFPLVAMATDTLKHQISAQVDSTPIYIDKVIGTGTGLSATYVGQRKIGSICQDNNWTVTQVDPVVDFVWGNNPPVSSICSQNAGGKPLYYTVTWKGKLQPRYSEYYKFGGYVSGGLAAVKVKSSTDSVFLITTGGYESAPIYLEAGNLYTIQVEFVRRRRDRNPAIELWWKSNINQQQEIIPQNFLYPDYMTATDTIGSMIRDIQYYCIKLNKVKSQNGTTIGFSPYRQTKMVVGGWVRIDGSDFNTANPLEGVITAGFDQGGSTVNLVKRGVRIEGWQRYESVIDIPWNATQLIISLKGVSSRNVLFDDIRIQPFNSNMKSYVYDPINLRLMAELDENNYASFYEYDDDGTLIRVKKETEKGVMTISETRSALIKE